MKQHSYYTMCPPQPPPPPRLVRATALPYLHTGTQNHLQNKTEQVSSTATKPAKKMLPSSLSIPTHLANYESDMTIECPSVFDVLCGSKSTAVNDHPGNHLFRQKIVRSLPAYAQARTKKQKMQINRKIVDFMRQKYGSRFLKQNSNNCTWSMAEEQAIRDKVSHALCYAHAHHRHAQTFRAAGQAARRLVAMVEPVASAFPQDHPHHDYYYDYNDTTNTEEDSLQSQLDEIHRRQLSLLGLVLTQNVRDELEGNNENARRGGDDDEGDSLSGLSNFE